MGRMASELRAYGAGSTTDEGDPLTTDEIRAGHAVQQRAELIFDRGPVVRFIEEVADIGGGLADRLLDEAPRAEHVDRRLQLLVGRLRMAAAQRLPVAARARPSLGGGG